MGDPLVDLIWVGIHVHQPHVRLSLIIRSHIGLAASLFIGCQVKARARTTWEGIPAYNRP